MKRKTNPGSILSPDYVNYKRFTLNCCNFRLVNFAAGILSIVHAFKLLLWEILIINRKNDITNSI